MSYCYALTLLDADGHPGEEIPLEPEWEPALAWARLQGIREGRLRPATAGAGAVEPIWDERRGAPFVAALRAVVPASDATDVACDIPRRYLLDAIRTASATLVARGVLAPGDERGFAVTARRAPAADPPDGFLVIAEDPQPLPLTETPLARFLARSRPAAATDTDDGVPVFVPRRVLDEAACLARTRGGEVETGGVLLGALHRDTHVGADGVREIFVEVTAQLPAEHTEAGATHLTFTPDTWAAIHAAIALRGDRPQLLGFWHLHPDFCAIRRCPPERRVACTATTPFFSPEDVRFMTVCFPAAHQIGLLLSERSDTGITPSVYGWARGLIAPRRFHILDDEASHGG